MLERITVSKFYSQKGQVKVFMSKLPLWTDKGLFFSCTGCGKCCTGSPGYVWVTEEECKAIAEYLELSFKDFMMRYVRQVGDRYSLVERRKNYDCIFLDGKKCTIYPHRPKQCKTFPWWKEHLSSPKAWEDLASYCEGVNHPEASLVSIKEIEDILYS